MTNMLQPLTKDIALALRLITSNRTDDTQLSLILTQLIPRLHSACNMALPGPSFMLLFPTVQAALSLSLPQNAHDAAMSLLSMHTAPTLKIQRAPMVALLIGTITRFVRLRQPAEAALLKICAAADQPAVMELLHGYVFYWPVGSLLCGCGIVVVWLCHRLGSCSAML